MLTGIFFSVRITTSVYPVPVICRIDQLGDWFESLANILHWNLRKSQLSLDSSRIQRDDDESKSDDRDSSPSIAAPESSVDIKI